MLTLTRLVVLLVLPVLSLFCVCVYVCMYDSLAKHLAVHEIRSYVM